MVAGSIDPPPPLRPIASEGQSAESAVNTMLFGARLEAFISRVEAACVVACIGAENTGVRTLNSLMGRMTERDPDSCNREAAEVMWIVLAELLRGAPRPLIERILIAVAERESFVEGLD
ncbi:hypothetical protein BLA3211_08409 [Burkholderia aenigmatica]|uniref:Uncharacterized protein n=1 Tax=Burkholderia aenigmatica TaxID=2015348 RepID=A0A6J5JW12_9BURK|nr:hypothetical protein [Burkholderia aenigmatica]CAB3975275.1 hypothetical protein BLA3211_08409 [Burkholderia aenigmatica]